MIALVIAIGSMSVTGFAADQLRIDQPDTAPQQDRLKQGDQAGSQLMLPEDRADFRGRMQAAQTVEERQRIRTEQRAMLEERAAAQGVTLPDSLRMSGQRFDRGANPGMGGISGMGGGPGR